MPEPLEAKFDRFMALAGENVKSRPWLVVVLMHEYFRHLYPSDPHIPLADTGGSAAARIDSVLDTCIQWLAGAGAVGSYFEHRPNCMESILAEIAPRGPQRSDESPTQQVYGKLWDGFDAETYQKEAYEILEQRLAGNEFELSELKGKAVLDMGCGSGRYTIALAMTGAGRVYGIDLGAASIDRAATIAGEIGLTNVSFQVGNVLELPFAGTAFDFVFCNGVLHHTEDVAKGIRELYRVLKPQARAFLYLYADGGLFWYSRKQMRTVMQHIPQDYTMAVLDLIGMPRHRFIFTDNWYVPIERHTPRAKLEAYLREVGFSSMRKIVSGRPTDLDSQAVLNHPEAQTLWGDGEHRYLLGRG